MSDLWRLVFDDERFNDMDMHHFSWGSAYKVEVSDEIIQAFKDGCNRNPVPLTDDQIRMGLETIWSGETP